MAETTAKKGPGAFSRWMQKSANARTNKKIRKGNGRMMGMELLILHTVGRHSGEPRVTPLAWFPDGSSDSTDAWLVVGSGGGDLHPDWFANLVAHPDRTAVELPGGEAVPVTPQRLEGPAREDAWQRITAANPRLGKYQAKSKRIYPVIRLSSSAT